MKTQRIRIKKNEERIIPFIWKDDQESEFEIEVFLSGEGASVKVIGIFSGTGNNKLVFNMKIIHEAPKTKSLTLIRSVFADTASFSNDGLIVIKKGAKGADGYFASKVLLFGDGKGRSVPSLEIDENDLKAGHASTIGRPDPQELFYLQSRGLSEEEATKLIVAGFFDPLLLLLSESEQKEARKKLSV